ncbi:MAG: glycoside hydrolase family 28 protein [Bacteroidales bacterium]|nr:glycoside hydrolase family 28 protein [Bacteroidales bacterium]
MAKYFFKSLIFSLLTLFAFSCQNNGKRLHNIPFQMPDIQAPNIPSRDVVLTDFGAEGDGVTICTEAFEKAFARLEEQGGGRLIVPDGIWFTGPIGLKSHTELHLQDNAVIIFSANQDLYPIIPTSFEGLDMMRCLSPIHADGLTDIAITGKGIIDGNGTPWRELKRRKVGDDIWKPTVKKGGVLSDDGSVWYPDEGYKKARLTAGSLNKQADSLDLQEIKTFLRPVLVSIKNCERVLLEGVTFQNSPAWNLHPLWCKDVTVRDIVVRNPHYSTNGDGIDIESCDGVILTGSSFDVGDDAICIKSGKDEDGRRYARPCRNVVIENCTVYHGHGGFVIGSEMSGGAENILVRDCKFIGTDVGLRFKSTRGRGGLVKDIWCSNIYMKDIVAEAVTFNLYYAGVASTEKADAPVEDILPPVDETTPEFRDIHFDGLVCAGAKQAVYINGLPELPLRNVDFKNSSFTALKGLEMHNTENVTFEGVTVNGETL